MRGVLGFLVVGLFAGGCAVYSSQPVGVTVIDAETGAPLPHATVRVSYRQLPDTKLNVPGPKSIRTDDAGRGEIEVTDFQSGALWEVSADGYLDHWSVAPPPQRVPDEFRMDEATLHEAVIALYRGPKPTVEVLVAAGFRGPLGVRMVPIRGEGMGKRTFIFAAMPDGRVDIEASALLRRDLEWTRFLIRDTDGNVIERERELVGNDEMISARQVTPVPAGTIWVVGTARDQAFVRALMDPWRSRDGTYSSFDFSAWPQIMTRWSAARDGASEP